MIFNFALDFILKNWQLEHFERMLLLLKYCFTDIEVSFHQIHHRSRHPEELPENINQFRKPLLINVFHKHHLRHMVKTYWKANLNKSLYRLLQFPDQLHLSSQGYSDLGQLKPDQPRLCCQGESLNLSKSTCGRLCIPSLKSSVQSTIRLSMWPKAPLITRSGTISTFRGKDIWNIVVEFIWRKGSLVLIRGTGFTSLPSTSSFMTTAGGSSPSTCLGILQRKVRYLNQYIDIYGWPSECLDILQRKVIMMSIHSNLW